MFELEGSFGKRVVGIIGGRVKIRNINELLRKLAEIDRENRTTSQIFDASRVAGKIHLLHAAHLALAARATGKGFAQSLDIELICWVAGLRQIERALKRVGIRRGEQSVALLTIGDAHQQVQCAQREIVKRLEIRRDDKVLEITSDKSGDLIRSFSIREQELKTASVSELILERVALLSLQH